MWCLFFITVGVLLFLDLNVFEKRRKSLDFKTSLKLSAFYGLIGLIFGFLVFLCFGAKSGIDYLTGFFIEKSLSMDNLFVMSVIFNYLNIPAHLQHRVLFWGVLGVLVLRAILIGIGAIMVHSFSWIIYFFGFFLLFTGIKMAFSKHVPLDLKNNKLLIFIKRYFRVTPQLEGNHFWVKRPSENNPREKVWYATPLWVALVLIECADLVFAVDSVPAIFAITSDPFIVYTSNIFAILGLRALYFALASLLHRFVYLKYSLGLILVFIGGKILAAEIIGKVPAVVSLLVTVGLLGGGVVFSLLKTKPFASAAN